jgi:transcriptional regulator with XRE-family HTH domain
MTNDKDRSGNKTNKRSAKPNPRGPVGTEKTVNKDQNRSEAEITDNTNTRRHQEIAETIEETKTTPENKPGQARVEFKATRDKKITSETQKSARNPPSNNKRSEQSDKQIDADNELETNKPEPWVSEETISALFNRVGSATSNAFRFAKKTTNTSYRVGKALIQNQDQLKVMLAAGQSLKDLREVAGLTVSELSEALQLKDQSLLEAVENGTATLSFELILRLSSLLARNDPIPFILQYSRTYSPDTWKLLHDWGAGRLPLQYVREREFINIFRSRDDARNLSDEGFNQVLEYTRQAFNLSLHFIGEQEAKIDQLQAELDQLKSQVKNQKQDNDGK